MVWHGFWLWSPNSTSISRSMPDNGGMIWHLWKPSRIASGDMAAEATLPDSKWNALADCLFNGLVWDWAIAVDDRKMISLLRSRSIDFYGKDRGYPLHLEPSGEDFLSSSLGAASLMSRVLNMADFSMWLEQTMPGISEDIPLSPVANPDPCDGRLTHLDGLNLSRAWMLRDISNHLPHDDPRQANLKRIAEDHARRGLDSIATDQYAGSHWLGTFAAYLSCRMCST